MKNLLKISTIAFLLIAGVSCENDDQTIANSSGGPQLLTPIDGSAYTLNPATGSDEVTTLVWNHADYSVQTEVNYAVEVALAGTDFASVFPGGSTTNRFIVWTHEALNAVALEAGMVPYTAGDLDIRIKSSLGSNNEIVAYSNVITLSITPYTTETPKLWMPGSYQADSGYGNNWTQSSAATLASEGYGNTNFEGYVYFNSNQASPDNGFKFSSQANWDGTNYGDDGTFSGMLSSSGGNIDLTAGYYRVTANTTALTYNMTATQWGIAGNATTNGWDGMIPMTYDPTTKKWSVIATLTTQAAPDNGLKFKANGGWDINLGDNGADGSAEYGGTNISTTAGTYLIELDLSNPRAYTYTLTPQ
jgi:starch-binding outer membrane protein SusE/F